ncbi:MAG: hypothetical protein N4Q30_06740, partial [Neisseriaceae bacterium]|nr:hypothetical protein [Neisseriaceae bacterium]
APVCREYENFIPQVTSAIPQTSEEKFTATEKYSSEKQPSSKSDISVKKDVINAACNGDQFCAAIAANSVIQNNQSERNKNNLDYQNKHNNQGQGDQYNQGGQYNQSRQNNQGQINQYDQSSQYNQNNQYNNEISNNDYASKYSLGSDSMEKYSTQSKPIVNTTSTQTIPNSSIENEIRNVDYFIDSGASKILGPNWLDEVKNMPIAALMASDSNSVSDKRSPSSSTVTPIEKNSLNSSTGKARDLSLNPNSSLLTTDSIPSEKLALPNNFSNELQPSQRVVAPVGVAQDQEKSKKSEKSKLTQEEILAANELGETLMQNQLNQNLQTFFDSMSKGQEKGLMEAQKREQQERLAQQEMAKKQAQAVAAARSAVSYPPAVQILKTSCDNNNIQSCYDLAVAFNKGQAGAQNRNKAQEVYNDVCSMAQRGNTEGQYYCARLNIEGEIVEPNVGQAIQLLNQSCQKSFQKSCESLEMLKQIGVNTIDR